MERLPFLRGEPGSGLPALLLPVLLRWAGGPGASGDEIDPGLHLLAGAGPYTLGSLRKIWQPAETSPALDDFERDCLGLLADQRLLTSEALTVYLIPFGEGKALILSNTEGLWPLGRLLRYPDAAPRILDEMLAVWKTAVGDPAQTVFVSSELAEILNHPKDRQPDRPTGCEIMPLEPGAEDRPHQEYFAERERILEALESLSSGALDLPQLDLSIALLAASLVRLWARWMRSFSASSLPYLLDQFIRRGGRVRPWPQSLTAFNQPAQPLLIELDSRPLDIVLEMAGYLSPLEFISWLDGRKVEFELNSR
jgi:hypothetical protein